MNCNTKHLIGCPGGGKTHAAIRHISAILSSRVRSDQIAFVSFTRAAIKEARQRVGERFGLSRDDLPYFGTLHSLAYRSLSLSRDQVLTGKKWAEFCKSVGLRYSSSDGIPDDDFLEPLGNEEGDVLRRFYDWRRSCELEMEPALKLFDPGPFDEWRKGRALWFTQQFEEWKEAEGLYDFCDFLSELASSGWIPPVRLLIVDEAQDLSPLQRRIVIFWAEQIGHLLLAYDPDQTIFDFQGADPKWLLDLEGQREFLAQSHRVPKRPAHISRRIINRNKQRYRYEWEGTQDDGEVLFDQDLDKAIRLCAKEGKTLYFLARNRCYLLRYTNALMDAGIPFHNLRGHTPRAGMGAVCAFRLARGETVTLSALKHLADDTAQKEWWGRGAKTELEKKAKQDPDAPIRLDQITILGALPELHRQLSDPKTCLVPLKTAEEKKQFYARVYQRLGLDGLTESPLVTVSTIHGVKGGEAQNVVIDPQMTRRVAEHFDTHPEPERRVWYVGASRTQNRLITLDTGMNAYYDEW